MCTHVHTRRVSESIEESKETETVYEFSVYSFDVVLLVMMIVMNQEVYSHHEIVVV